MVLLGCFSKWKMAKAVKGFLDGWDWIFKNILKVNFSGLCLIWILFTYAVPSWGGVKSNTTGTAYHLGRCCSHSPLFGGKQSWGRELLSYMRDIWGKHSAIPVTFSSYISPLKRRLKYVVPVKLRGEIACFFPQTCHKPQIYLHKCHFTPSSSPFPSLPTDSQKNWLWMFSCHLPLHQVLPRFVSVQLL